MNNSKSITDLKESLSKFSKIWDTALDGDLKRVGTGELLSLAKNIADYPDSIVSSLSKDELVYFNNAKSYLSVTANK